MFENIVIPSPDPLPLPAPIWLLKFFLLFTFTLHVVPMNFVLSGGFIAAIAHTIGKRRQSEHHLSVACGLGRMIPYAVAAAITFGVAPLLFLQVLYGQFFYTSSILMAWPWLSVILLVIIGYYGFYWYFFRLQDQLSQRLISLRLRSPSLWVLWVSSVLFLLIGFLYTNNIVLMLTPEIWQSLYATSPYGAHLNLSEPIIIPRFLHFFVGSFAVSGLLVVLHGVWKRKREPEQGQWTIRYGSKWFIGATLVQFAVGVLFLFSLPEKMQSMFLGGDATATSLLIAGIVFALLAIILLVTTQSSEKLGSRSIAASVSVVLTVSTMVILRDIVRTKYLEPYFDVNTLKADSQWGVLILFGILLVLAIGLIAFMITKAARFGRSTSATSV